MTRLRAQDYQQRSSSPPISAWHYQQRSSSPPISAGVGSDGVNLHLIADNFQSLSIPSFVLARASFHREGKFIKHFGSFIPFRLCFEIVSKNINELYFLRLVNKIYSCEHKAHHDMVLYRLKKWDIFYVEILDSIFYKLEFLSRITTRLFAFKQHKPK